MGLGTERCFSGVYFERKCRNSCFLTVIPTPPNHQVHVIPRRFIREGVLQNVACSQNAHKYDMAAVDTSPSYEACNGSDIQQLCEDCPTVCRKVQESEQAEYQSECYGSIGDFFTICLLLSSGADLS
jgi:hypothetical protein